MPGDPRDLNGDGQVDVSEWLMGALGSVKQGVVGGIRMADTASRRILGKPIMPFPSQQLPDPAAQALGIPQNPFPPGTQGYYNWSPGMPGPGGAPKAPAFTPKLTKTTKTIGAATGATRGKSMAGRGGTRRR